MAFLRDHHKKDIILLKIKHLIGRMEDSVDTLLKDRACSRIHVSINWIGDRWEILDHSRNGSWLNGLPLKGGAPKVLKQGDVISLVDSKKANFTVEDISPPVACLVENSQEESMIALNSFHALPSSDNPLLSILKKEDQWYLETPESQSKLASGDKIEIEGKPWTFFNPWNSELTQIASKTKGSDGVSFTFMPTPSLENVSLIAITPKGQIDFGVRIHHLLLLLLAIARDVDLNSGLDPLECGWRDAKLLAQEMKLDLSHLNIQVFRARKQIISQLDSFFSPDQIIARRGSDIRLSLNSYKIQASFSLPTI